MEIPNRHTKQSFFARRSFTILVIACFAMPFLWMGSIRTIRSNRNDVKDWLPDDFRETAVHSWFNKHFPHEQFVLGSWEGCTLGDQRLQMMVEKLVPPEEDPSVKKPLTVEGTLIVEGAAPEMSSAKPESELPAEEEANKEPNFFKSVITGRTLVDELTARYPELTAEEVFSRLEGTLIGADHNRTCFVVILSNEAKGKNLRKSLAKIRELAAECGIDPIYMGGPPVDNAAIDIEGERTLMRLAGLSLVVGLGISWLCFRSMWLTFLVFFTAILATGTAMASVHAAGLFVPKAYDTWSTCDAILLTMPSLVYVLAISSSIHIVNYYHDAIRDRGLKGATDRGIADAWLPCTIAALTTALGLGSLVVSHVIPISKFGVYSAIGVIGTLLWVFFYLPACLTLWPSRKYARSSGEQGDMQNAVQDSVFLRFWRTIGGFVIRHNVSVSLGCMAVMVFFVFGIVNVSATVNALCRGELRVVPRIKTSVKLMKLFSPEAEIISHYQWLEDHLGPLVPMEVVIHVDNQKCKLSFVERMRLAQYIEATLEELRDVGGALSAGTFAPDLKPDRRKATTAEKLLGIDPMRMREQVLNKRLQEHRDEFREYVTIDVEFAVDSDRCDPSLAQLGIPEDIVEKLEAKGIYTLDEIENYGNLQSIKGVGPRGDDLVAKSIETWRQEHPNPTLEELGITGELAEKLKVRKVYTLLDIERFGEKGSIKENFGEIRGFTPQQVGKIAATVRNWRVSHGEELWRITARVEALSDLDYGLFVEDIRNKVEPILDAVRESGVDGIDATYTGLVPLVYKTQHELMKGLFESLALAFVLIAFVMMIVLRSPSAGLVAMVPNLFPVIVIFGIMGWLGVLIDIGSMMTASVALGVAVDDTIHYLTWYRKGLDRGLDRKGAVLMAYEKCATAMTQTTIIGGLGLAVFAFSTFTPTQRFGTLMLVLLIAALFGDLIFLPAVLSSPLGRFFRGSKKHKAKDKDRNTLIESPSKLPNNEVTLPAAPAKRSVRRDPKHSSHKTS